MSENGRYRIVKGSPSEVEQEVDQLISQGWQLRGDPMLYNLADADRSRQIVLQPMERNDERTT